MMPFCKECGCCFQGETGVDIICPICKPWKEKVATLEAQNTKLSRKLSMQFHEFNDALNDCCRQLGELREAATWYFECYECHDFMYDCQYDYEWITDDGVEDVYDIYVEAERALRAMLNDVPRKTVRYTLSVNPPTDGEAP